MNRVWLLLLLGVAVSVSDQSYILAQNVAINIAGTAAAGTNMFEVTQTSSAANMVAIYAINSGATAGTGYGLYATKTGAGTTNVAALFSASGGTNNYGLIIPAGSGLTGLGTSTPNVQLHVVSNIPTSTSLLHPYRTGMIIEGDQNTFGGRLCVRQAGGTGLISIFGTSGSLASPSAALSGDVLGILSFGGYDGSIVNSFYGINGIAAENWTSSAHGVHLGFKTIQIGGPFTNGGTERVRITSEGDVGIGNSSPAERLHVTGNIRGSTLAGTGTQLVAADANGTLQRTSISTGSVSGSGGCCGVWTLVDVVNSTNAGSAGKYYGTAGIAQTGKEYLIIAIGRVAGDFTLATSDNVMLMKGSVVTPGAVDGTSGNYEVAHSYAFVTPVAGVTVTTKKIYICVQFLNGNASDVFEYSVTAGTTFNVGITGAGTFYVNDTFVNADCGLYVFER